MSLQTDNAGGFWTIGSRPKPPPGPQSSFFLNNIATPPQVTTVWGNAVASASQDLNIRRGYTLFYSGFGVCRLLPTIAGSGARIQFALSFISSDGAISLDLLNGVSYMSYVVGPSPASNQPMWPPTPLMGSYTFTSNMIGHLSTACVIVPINDPNIVVTLNQVRGRADILPPNMVGTGT